MSSKLLGGALSLVILSGCNTVHPQSGSADPGLGEALKYDMAIQVIDPEPVYGPEDAQPGDHGGKAAAAVRRYRTDAVKDVEASDTTAGTGGPS